MKNKFFSYKEVEVTNQFVINYTILAPSLSFMNAYFDFYQDLKSQNRPNIFFKFNQIYIITKIQLNRNHTPLTLNPIFKIKYQKLLSIHTKNSNLLYLNKREKFSYFTSNNKLQIIKIKKIKLV